MKIIGRKEAKQLQLKRYFTGKPCVRGHISERYTAKGSCIECLDNYRVDHPEKFKQTAQKSKQKNKDKLNLYSRLYRLKHKEKCANAVKKWGVKNKHMIQYYVRKRQAAQLNRTPSWLSKIDFFEMECIYKYCASLRKIGLKYAVDHIIPLQGKQVSGLHVPSNLQVIHSSVNSAKGNKYEI